jgi:hypothetical protein
MRDTKVITGHLAVRPATLEYVQWREFLAKKQPIQIPGRSPVASFLQTQLSFCVLFHSEGFFPPPPAPQLTGFTCHLPFEVHGSLATEHIFQLLDFTAARFEEFIVSLMWDDLTREIINGKHAKQHEKTIVENFLRERHLEDHIQWDAAVKAIYRLRKGRDIPTFRGYSRFTQPQAIAV